MPERLHRPVAPAATISNAPETEPHRTAKETTPTLAHPPGSVRDELAPDRPVAGLEDVHEQARRRVEAGQRLGCRHALSSASEHGRRGASSPPACDPGLVVLR